jgi:hypothetical protein
MLLCTPISQKNLSQKDSFFILKTNPQEWKKRAKKQFFYQVLRVRKVRFAIP